ncbi:hypothetical protein ABER99_26225 [Paenibacillus glucanolyticus]
MNYSCRKACGSGYKQSSSSEWAAFLVNTGGAGTAGVHSMSIL